MLQPTLLGDLLCLSSVLLSMSMLCRHLIECVVQSFLLCSVVTDDVLV